MIRAETLTKQFGSFSAIERVTFDVGRGEIVGFVGPNGAGKTTTIRILAGVFPPTRGRALVAGHDVAQEPLAARAVVGYLPERVALFSDPTVEEYLRWVARLKGLDRRSAAQAVSRVLDGCGLAHVAGRIIGSLSKGYRQRIGLAQALVGKPAVLLLDEPAAGLDPAQAAELRDLLLSLRGTTSILLSSHNLTEIESVCDRVIILHRGRVHAVDTPERLGARLRDTTRIHLEVAGPSIAEVVERLRLIPGVLRIEERPGDDSGCLRCVVSTQPERDLRDTIADVVHAAGWRLRELRALPLSLQEIFLSVVAPKDARGDAGPPDTLGDPPDQARGTSWPPC